ncbi:Uncharacterised protein [Enterobacter cloacae]|nr:Uncharacterised protein [Enterobacter cloacae]
MAEFTGEASSGVNLEQQFCQVNGWKQLSDSAAQLYQRRWFIQFIQAADGQRRMFTFIADVHGGIAIKT